MAFKTDQQRRGFFARLGQLQENHRINVQVKLDDTIKKEEAELARLNEQLKEKTLHRQIEVAKNQQVVNQRQQIADLRTSEREARAAIRAQSATGRAFAATKRFATSDQTKAVLRGIGRALAEKPTRKRRKKK